MKNTILQSGFCASFQRDVSKTVFRSMACNFLAGFFFLGKGWRTAKAEKMKRQTGFHPFLRFRNGVRILVVGVIVLLTGAIVASAQEPIVTITKTIVNRDNPAHLYLVQLQSDSADGRRLQYVFVDSLTGINQYVLNTLISSVKSPYKELLSDFEVEEPLTRIFNYQSSANINTAYIDQHPELDWADAMNILNNQNIMQGSGNITTWMLDAVDEDSLAEFTDEYEIVEDTVNAKFILAQRSETEYIYHDGKLTPKIKIEIFLYHIIIHCIFLEKEIIVPVNYHITLSANDTMMGTVTGSGYYAENSTAILRATPYNGYRFVQWNDNNIENPRRITVTGDSIFTAMFDRTTGIETLGMSPIKIYPNPATENITVTLPENISQAVFTLYDMQGKELIKREIGNQEKVLVNALSVGIYIYKITTTKEGYTGKIIIKK
jgi:hypothetical protein